MSRLAPAAACVLVVALACQDPAVRKAREAEAARARIAAESSVAASAVSATPQAGRWTAALVTKRLVDAGLAPQRRDSVASQPFLGVPVLALTLGVARVDAYIYADSAARAAAVARLDPLTFAPHGRPSPWGAPREIVQNGNLVAVVVGGTDRQRDRIVTALAAGIGAP
jgi:hypothetical protein